MCGVVAVVGKQNASQLVMEGLKKNSTLLNFVSFSSPSGYENAESESLDFKFYLPFDFFWSISRIIKLKSVSYLPSIVTPYPFFVFTIPLHQFG